MIHQKTLIFFTLAILAVITTAAVITPSKKYKNLKVLPQDITEEKLDSVMHAYNKALKVSCDFCHMPIKDISAITPGNEQIDFSTDNDMKENARRMIRLTIDINKTYFNFDSTKKPDYMLNVISCNTCHRGNPFPVNE